MYQGSERRKHSFLEKSGRKGKKVKNIERSLKTKNLPKESFAILSDYLKNFFLSQSPPKGRAFIRFLDIF